MFFEKDLSEIEMPISLLESQQEPKAKPKVVVITGATSGIGLALAEKYLQEDYNVIITGRTDCKVSYTRDKLSKYSNFKGAYCFDVVKIDEMKEHMDLIQQEYEIDMFVANAGISAGVLAGSSKSEEDFVKNLQTQGEEIFQTNVLGVFNSVNSVLFNMLKNEKGTIVLISSMAAFFGLKSAIFYASSKAAVKSYGEGLRSLLKNHGVNVITVFPGFVESNITKANNFKMPFYMTGSEAARIIFRDIKKGKSYIVFPRLMYIAVYLISILPNFLREKIIDTMPNK